MELAMAAHSMQRTAQLRAPPPLAPPPPAGSRRRRRGRAAAAPRAAADAAPPAPTATPADATDGEAPATWPSAAARAALFSSASPPRAAHTPAAVTGRLPAWLRGTYARNGPGSYDNGAPGGMRHMFDGYAMVASFRLDGGGGEAGEGAVTSSHEFLDTAAWRAVRDGGRQRWREFATPTPHTSPLGAAAEMVGMVAGAVGLGDAVTDNASVSLLPRGRAPGPTALWAATETVVGTYAVDPRTLRTLGRLRFSDGLRGDLTTAHPKALPGGRVVNILSTIGVGYQVIEYPPAAAAAAAPAPGRGGAPEVAAGARRLLATAPHRRALAPAWVHDFPCSAAHAVVPEAPLYFNLPALMTGGATPHVVMDWAPADGARLHVAGLGGGRLPAGAVATAALDRPFFAFHWANAFESADGGVLHIDGAVYDTPDVVNDFYLGACRAGHAPGAAGVSRSALRRLSIDLGALAAAAAARAARGGGGAPPVVEGAAGAWRQLAGDAATGGFVEFPAVNPARRGREHRYVWATAAARPTNLANALVKVDTRTGACARWAEPGGAVGEPVMVPRPGGGAEDDGVVLTVVAQRDGRAALVVLDAAGLGELARAVLPYGLPNGFHGCFLPDWEEE